MYNAFHKYSFPKAKVPLTSEQVLNCSKISTHVLQWLGQASHVPTWIGLWKQLSAVLSLELGSESDHSAVLVRRRILIRRSFL